MKQGNPKNIEQIADNAEIYYRQGKLASAAALCQEAIKINPDCYPAYKTLGDILLAEGKIKPGVRAHTRAIALQPEPERANSYWQLGNILAEIEEFYGAIACYIQALQRQPDFASVYRDLGNTLTKLGLNEEASKCYRQKLPLNLLVQFSQSAKDWATSCQYPQRHKMTHIPIHPPGKLYLSPPKTPDGKVLGHFCLSELELSETFVGVLENARAWASYYTIAVFTSENKLLKKVSSGNFELIASSPHLPPPRQLDGTVAFLSVRWGSTYFHWLSDLLPRIELLRLSGIDLADIDFFVVNSHDFSFQKETLSQLGIPKTKIIPSSQFPHIQAERLAIPFLHYRGGQWVADFLRREFLPKSGIEEFSETRRLSLEQDLLIDSICRGSTAHQHLSIAIDRVSPVGQSQYIYISRSQAGMRRIVNEEKLIDALVLLGFQAIVLESMPFSEQVATLAAAQVVVAPHGGGLTNLAFCRPGTKVVEIFSPDYINGCYWLLGHQVGIEYYYFLGETLEAKEADSPEQNRGDRDIWVDVPSLLDLLEFAGV
ncbi:MAG: DUF563 domain-containing protein [Oscillatoria sp. SIO1A7]|nr:DUF563 domain-containing protein [Oscillatoria sp. SIO1A7]